jgi:hypothetical protein
MKNYVPMYKKFNTFNFPKKNYAEKSQKRFFQTLKPTKTILGNKITRLFFYFLRAQQKSFPVK